MVETAKTIELDPIQGDYEPVSVVQRVQGDHFTHKQLFAKLGTLEVSHFRDLVIIYANKVWFSAIPGSLFNGRQLSDKMTHEVDVPYGNSYSKCPCSQGVFRGREDTNDECARKWFMSLGLWSKYNVNGDVDVWDSDVLCLEPELSVGRIDMWVIGMVPILANCFSHFITSKLKRQIFSEPDER
ncbi:hypothetical protein RND81_04G088200 [Saponaria officinalis]|uniref:Uncharacterized protein n=1 Tax=Saponaria officinalis TaxID=3572 RepID=A0AAW1LL04_SAPOF